MSMADLVEGAEFIGSGEFDVERPAPLPPFAEGPLWVESGRWRHDLSAGLVS